MNKNSGEKRVLPHHWDCTVPMTPSWKDHEGLCTPLSAQNPVNCAKERQW